MKKVLNWVSVVALWVSAALFGVSVILPSLSEEAIEASYSVVVLASYLVVVLGIVGAVMIFAKNDTAKKIGHGLYIAALVLSLGIALRFIGVEDGASTDLTEVEETVTSIAAVFVMIAAILAAVYYVLQLVILILSKGAKDGESPLTDSRIIRVKEWKQLMGEGIITKEEFEEKRVAILGLNKDKAKE